MSHSTAPSWDDDDGADPYEALDFEIESAERAAIAEPPPFEAREDVDDQADDPFSDDGFGEEYVPTGGVSGASVGADQPIPRIMAYAFCERSFVAHALEAASQDRRMAKASMSIEMGGFDAAVTRLQQQASPNLLILDSAAGPTELLAALDRLAEYVDAGSKAIVIGAVNDITLYRELMKRGVSEYLVAPVDPVHLIRTISSLFADPDKPFAGRVTAVVGAKGGVGSSTIAQNIAWCMAERFQANSTLVDFDAAFGTAALNFDEDADLGVGEALQRIDQIDATYVERLLVRHTQRLALFPATAALERQADADADAYDTLLSHIRLSAPFIVLDLPHLWSAWMNRLLLSVDDILIVATPELASLRNTKNLLDLVRARRPNDSPPIIVLNMVGVPKRPEIPVRDFAKTLGVEPGAVIPFDPMTFGQASNNGEMVASMAPQSKPSLAIESLARAICGREPAPVKRASFVDQLKALSKR